MWWATKKEPSLAEVEQSRVQDEGFNELKNKFKKNRSDFGRGSGEDYWESVVLVAETHFGKRA